MSTHSKAIGGEKKINWLLNTQTDRCELIHKTGRKESRFSWENIKSDGHGNLESTMGGEVEH